MLAHASRGLFHLQELIDLHAADASLQVGLSQEYETIEKLISVLPQWCTFSKNPNYPLRIGDQDERRCQ